MATLVEFVISKFAYKAKRDCSDVISAKRIIAERLHQQIVAAICHRLILRFSLDGRRPKQGKPYVANDQVVGFAGGGGPSASYAMFRRCVDHDLR